MTNVARHRVDATMPNSQAACPVVQGAGSVGDDTEQALLGLLGMHLRRDHRRLAIRRYLMLDACGFQVPLEFRERCEALLAERPTSDIDLIISQCRTWTNMVSRSPTRRRTGPEDALLSLQALCLQWAGMLR